MGISSLIYPEILAARDIIEGIKHSWIRQWWEVHDGALVMLGIKLRETAEILNIPLKILCGPDTCYHVVAVKRDDMTIIPNGDATLQLGDIVYFMTTKKYIPYIRKIVGKEHYEDVKNVMIMGGGRTAMHTALNVPGYMEVKIIESDPARCNELNEALGDSDVMVINGDARDSSLLITEGIQHTQAFVALTGQSESNILACLTAKRLGVRKTVALIDNLDYISMAERLDIGTIINKKTIAASHIYQMMLDSDVTNVKCLTVADADVAEFEVKSGAKVTKKPVKDLGLPTGVAIGGLVRNGEGMHVNGLTQIQKATAWSYLPKHVHQEVGQVFCIAPASMRSNKRRMSRSKQFIRRRILKPYILPQHVLHGILAMLVTRQFVLPLRVVLGQITDFTLTFFTQQNTNRIQQGRNHVVEQGMPLNIQISRLRGDPQT